MGAVRTFALRSTADSSTALDAWARVWQSDTSTRPTFQMDQASYFDGGNLQAQLIKLGWHRPGHRRTRTASPGASRACRRPGKA
jgi:hypothetical protein